MYRRPPNEPGRELLVVDDVRTAVKRFLSSALLIAVVLSAAAGCAPAPGVGGPAPAASASPLPVDRQAAPAPIDGLAIRIAGSAAPEYLLDLKAGLPSGCAMPYSTSQSRSGETITVTVLNSMPTGAAVCTAIYGTYEQTVSLGTDFRAGATYTVRVNDKGTTFTAR